MTPKAGDLSFAQERLWFLEQLVPGTPALHIAAVVRLRGPLNAAMLDRALLTIVERHETLRSSFPAVGGRPVQIVGGAPAKVLTTVAGDDEAIQADARKPFDLARGPLFRATLFVRHEDDHLLAVTMHHLVSDGWSMNVFIDELATIYGALSGGAEASLPELPIRYSDYVRWERARRGDASAGAALAYWREQLAGAAPLDLASDFDRSAAPSFSGARHHQFIGSDLRRSVECLAASAGVTPFIVMLTALFVFLARIAQQDDVTVGCPVANRDQECTHRLIGLFLGTLAIRMRLPEGINFRQLLREAKRLFLSALEHRSVPFERVVDALQVDRTLSAAPLFRVMFVFQNDGAAPLRFPGLEVTPHPIDTGGTPVDLTLYAMPSGDRWELTWEYANDLFRPESIRRMGLQFETLLTAAVASPDTLVTALDCAAHGEEALLAVWNETSVEGPDCTLVDLWRETAARMGDTCALRAGSDLVSYAMLDDRSSSLARHLIDLGVGRGVAAGVLLDRSPASATALLAILKACGAYVALDPDHPEELLRFIAKDAAIHVLVTESKYERLLCDAGIERVVIDRLPWLDSPTLTRSPFADDPAYLIYTSGSTGTPKGIVAPHRGAVNRLRWMWRRFPFTADERAVHHVSLNFVDSMWDLFGPLFAGVPVVLAPGGLSRDPEEFIAMLRDERITRVEMIPSLLEAVVAAAERQRAPIPDLEVCISSGEALPRRLAERFHAVAPRARLLNLYGSSEVAADVSYVDVAFDDDRTRVPIGVPIDNTRLYVLDESLRPVPLGANGELYAAGAGLAHGYHHLPALTADRFLPDPFGGEAGGRMFRTGDRARHRYDGALEIAGRVDFEVKIRGQRVDPSHVSSVLLAHPDVAEAVTIADASSSRLVAYVVPRRDMDVGATALRQFVAARVPPVMVPSIELLEAMPRTPNGKIDRAALPRVRTRWRDSSAHIAPRNEVERAIASIWREKLQVEHVGIDENFFEAGGHSLLLVQVQHRLAVVIGLRLSIASLFEFPTIRSLAGHLSTGPREDVATAIADRAATRIRMLDQVRARRVMEGR